MPKHAVKQVARLLSNQGIDVWDYFAYWVPFVVGDRDEAMVALDWTDFADDGQATIALSLLTGHGRATPLLWRTVKKSELKGQQTSFEDSLLARLKETLPAGVNAVGVRTCLLTQQAKATHGPALKETPQAAG
jgi:hypothetical protein